ncbi:MAG: lipopolysaccharide O-side chain biosynthesis protein (O-antigen transporter) [uncultured bacterium]|uniref:Polysaccharide biosynthesis protein n=1 Tax=Candidatus Wolfebacteria bacterium GW2011_GWE2_44_13 TaxID=1619017 RepID=A0A0G1JHR5_9BACT|nr:MAG: lipopolysaccharide O-side chain biosynthesis protein (O-antigen transporter) [uncultured bacterium]KKT43547.1 MAG: Polysaccharide biosynthesis protein [Candidatus Wolfebacteria bacterium GW2011_GWE2_44_13]
MLQRVKSLLLENKTTKQTIAKNTFWLFFGNIGSRLIRAGVIIYAARILGAEDWGIFSYALSLAAFFTVFTDFGISTVITRESAKDISVQEKYFSTSLILKVVMTVVSIAVFLALAPFLIRQKAVMALLPIIILLVSLDGMRDFAASLSRAWEKMEIEAAIQIITSVAITIGGIIALTYYGTSYALAAGYVIGVGIGMIAAFYPFRHYFINIKNTFDAKLIKPILYASWPIGMLGLMNATMLNTDTIMIGWFKDISDVGYYSAGQRISQILFIVPVLLTTALFPSFAKFALDKERFARAVEKSILILLMIAVPMAIGGAILAKDIMYLVYGDQYLAGSIAFAIMCLTVIYGFVAPVLGNAIFALNNEKQLFIYVILGISGNFLFNLFLIPRFGIAGAAFSTLLNQIIITLYLYHRLKKDITFSIRKKLSNIGIASCILFIAVIGLSIIESPVIITIFAAAGVYGYILYLLQEPAFMEIADPIIRRIKNA